jgi:hypothetical protein
VAEWERHRAAFLTTGLWPVFLGEGFDREGRADAYREDPPRVDEVVQAALAMDVDVRLRELAEEVPPPDLFDPRALQATPVAPWSERLYVLGEARRTVDLALVPVKVPYEVPAVLPFGEWNECPPDDVHVAVLRRWFTFFGAEPVAMTRDVIELRVARPIRDTEVARKVACEQYAYASDIVEQGCGSVRELAQTLLNSDLWFFWWD